MDKTNNTGNLARRITWVLIGNVIIGIGCALFRLAGLGTDPFSCMNLGVSSYLPISYGTYQMLLNFVLLIPMAIWYRKGINVGSFVNMIGVAYVSDLVVYLLKLAGWTSESVSGHMGARIIIMIIALIFYCIGVAFYVECELGVAPYDALGQMIEMWTGARVKFSVARILLDVFSVAVGFFTGSVIGVATLVTACMTGPLVTWIREHVARRAISGKSETPAAAVQMTKGSI